ncbi:GDSL-type esterase/lipase family protein [Hymenobacter sp. H14-R3]|uniref:SGNH/GDSL hydrolase family protein n=1 Tax=Hymenobacter sp. H14-R3 TaxID=3046308 RepID=UPI0024BA451E|nr:GDSL-type esterase/lipase family protein [Hymenobacter sp. H14-R3]MDJ0365012.1 GDSL-type esterase/lipase family protein [Hymenobacter sp. H14-R3]
MMPTPSIAYLALGDSYTIGEGAGYADRWPVQLAALARAYGLQLADPEVIAKTGWTTAELQEAIAASGNHRHDYGLVSLLVGVNNQYRGQSQALYRAEFRQLLATAQAYAGGQAGRVVVLSIPDWGQTPFAATQDRPPALLGHEIDQFNAVAQAECQAAGVAFVDITDLTRAAAGDAHQFTTDGLHYTSPHMRQWAARALPVVQGLLQ